MTKNKQDKDNRWEREHVQRVLDYHNKKYETHFAIKGKSIDIYPHLKEQEKQLNWDWVCYHTVTHDEVAVEVKKLTDAKLEEKSHIMWQLLEEIKNSLAKSKKLPGTFHLHANIPGDYNLPIKGEENKQELRNLLCEVICRTAPKLQIGEKADLDRRLRLTLRTMKKTGRQFYIPQTLSCTLTKIGNEGSALTIGSGQTYWQSPEFNNSELGKFEELISQANRQLQKANVKETFLLLIEGHSGRKPSEIAEVFRNIHTKSYSEIRWVYFVSFGEVTEIPLPTN